MSKKTVLVVEDEKDIVEILEYNLRREGYEVVSETRGDYALAAAKRSKPSVVLLDLMLPGMNGLEVCKELKTDSLTQSIPIIMVTAKGEESDIILGLELGADDYVCKPFSPKELVARVRAVMRRSLGSVKTTDDRIEAGVMTIDPSRHEVLLNGSSLSLTRAEFRLLHTLASQRGRVFTRDLLLEKITGDGSIVIDRNVDVHIGALRKKLGKESNLISTVRGVGYKFVD